MGTQGVLEDLLRKLAS